MLTFNVDGDTDDDAVDFPSTAPNACRDISAIVAFLSPMLIFTCLLAYPVAFIWYIYIYI